MLEQRSTNFCTHVNTPAFNWYSRLSVECRGNHEGRMARHLLAKSAMSVFRRENQLDRFQEGPRIAVTLRALS